jgi:hypothetical protein
VFFSGLARAVFLCYYRNKNAPYFPAIPTYCAHPHAWILCCLCSKRNSQSFQRCPKKEYRIVKQERTSIARKLAMQGFYATENSHNFFALLEFDVTDLRRFLREKRKIGEGGSLFACLLKVIAVCMKEHPIFNSMVKYNKISQFDSIDISIPIEITENGKTRNKQCLIKDVSEECKPDNGRNREFEKGIGR